MKRMTCTQLGGACDEEFHANTFEDIAEQSKNHGIAMFQRGDAAHLKAMDNMKEMMMSPHALKDWFDNKKREFEELPDDPH